jgi:hypothetical protein
MRNEVTTIEQNRISSQSSDRITTSRTELGEAELNQVCGGINPQPLPPRHDGGDPTIVRD